LREVVVAIMALISWYYTPLHVGLYSLLMEYVIYSCTLKLHTLHRHIIETHATGHVKSSTCFHGYVSLQVDLRTTSLGDLLILVHTKIAPSVHKIHSQEATEFTR